MATDRANTQKGQNTGHAVDAGADRVAPRVSLARQADTQPAALSARGYRGNLPVFCPCGENPS